MKELIRLKSTSGRDDYLDFLRGIAIIAVVVGHSISGNENASFLFHIIYSFHMPLLFWISGYVEEQKCCQYIEKPLRMLYKRGLSLLIPYCVWCIITNIEIGGTLNFRFEEFGNCFLGNAGGSLWFLPVLFGMKCMHVGFEQLAKLVWKRKAFITDAISLCICEIVVVILSLIVDISYFRNMITYAIPYFFAVFILRNKWLNDLLKKPFMIILCMVAYIVAFPFFDFVNVSSYTQLLRIFLSLCIIVVLLKCRGVKGWLGYSSICLFGRCSMGIYVLHACMLTYEGIIKLTDFWLLQNITAILLGIVVCWICVLIYSLLIHSKVLGGVLFGRWEKQAKALPWQM